ncbi:MAG1360 family OppF-related protein [Mycoplasma corogypsi]|uniref:MAG1360 family OppF-related protein n=1 Tax=Mycoplasma corogypsi TaxID=2106 RepID=UPI003872DF0F
MSRKFNYFTIGNIFGPVENNERIEYLNLPRINVNKGEITAFFISEKNTVLTLENLIEFLRNKKNNVSLGLFERGNYYNEKKLVVNQKEIKDIITFIDTRKLSSDLEIITPFVDMWNSGVNCSLEPEINEEVNTLLNEFDLPYKNAVFGPLREFIDNFAPIIEELKRSTNILLSRKFTKQANELDFITEAYKKLKIVRDTVFGHLFKTIVTLREVHQNSYSTYKKSNATSQKQLINDSEISLKYMRDINKHSMTKVISELKSRDYKLEMDFYHEYIEYIMDSAAKQYDFILKIIDGSIGNNYLKVNAVRDNKHKYYDILLEIYVYKKVRQIIKYCKKTLKYLNENEIWSLYHQIHSQSKLIITDESSIKDKTHRQIKKIIKNKVNIEFTHNFSNFVIIDKNRSNDIKQRIQKLKQDVKNINNIKFMQVASFNNLLKQHQLEQLIDSYRAEREWNTTSQKRLFGAIADVKTKYITNFKNKEKTLYSIIGKFSAYIDEINKKASQAIKINETFEKFSELVLFFNKVKWLFELFTDLTEFTNSKLLVNKKAIDKYINLIKFAGIYQNLSIPYAQFITPYKEQSLIEIIRLKLAKYIFLNKQIFMIQDNDIDSDSEVRNNVVRVVKRIIDKYQLTFMYITNNLYHIEKHFDYVHFFDNNTLIEGGKVDKLFANPINPWVKRLIKNRSLTYFEPAKDPLYIHDNIIYLDDDERYIYATYENYLRWTNQLTRHHHAENSHEKHASNTVEIDFVDSNDQLEFDLTDYQEFDSDKILDLQSDKKLFNELKTNPQEPLNKDEINENAF